MNRITLTIICMLLISCGIKKKKEIIDDVIFITHIKESGVKEFSYSATLNQKTKTMKSGGVASNRGSSGRGGARGGRGGGRGGNHDRSRNSSSQEISKEMESRVYKNLNEKLHAGYCRDGYIETERFFDKKHIQIKGYCNETATKADRKNHPNI